MFKFVAAATLAAAATVSAYSTEFCSTLEFVRLTALLTNVEAGGFGQGENIELCSADSEWNLLSLDAEGLKNNIDAVCFSPACQELIGNVTVFVPADCVITLNGVSGLNLKQVAEETTAYCGI